MDYLIPKVLYWSALAFMAGFGLGTITGLCFTHRGKRRINEQDLGDR